MPIARRLLRFAVDCWGIALILAAWQALVVVNDLNAIVMPRPLDTILEVVRQPGLYAAATLQTVTTAAAGLAFGLLIGCGVALAAWASRILGGLLTPLGLIFSSVPVVTLIPVLARIFGYTSATVVAIVAILSFFPFFVYGSAGLGDLPAGSDDLFRVLGARRRHRLVHLAGIAALPSWAIALRIAAPGSILAAMVGEFLMGTQGLGLLLSTAADAFRTEQALGASLCATALAIAVFSAAVAIEKAVVARVR